MLSQGPDAPLPLQAHGPFYVAHAQKVPGRGWVVAVFGALGTFSSSLDTTQLLSGGRIGVCCIKCQVAEIKNVNAGI